MTHSFDLNSLDHITDPYPSYARLRTEAPVYHSTDPDLWIVSRYDDVRTVLRDAARFSSDVGGLEANPFNPGLDRSNWLMSALARLSEVRVMLTSDPPDHTVLRRKVSRAFTPRRMAAWEPRIREVTVRLVDDMLAADRSADLVRDLASPLPTTVIAELLGVPTERNDDFKRWADDLINGLLTGGPRIPMFRSAIAISWFFLKTIRQRKRKPGDDLISVLVTGTGEDKLTHWELVTFCILLLGAGLETTTNLIANAMLAVFDRPELRQQLRDHPEVAAAVAAEALRFDSPGQGAIRRTLTEVTLSGTVIPEGAYVIPLIGSANRDPDQWTDPDEFVLDRPNLNEHLAFGSGIHYCIGNALARMEATAALEEIARRLPDMVPTGAPVRIASPVLRGLRSQPISFSRNSIRPPVVLSAAKDLVEPEILRSAQDDKVE